jgi:hypothetical protein
MTLDLIHRSRLIPGLWLRIKPPWQNGQGSQQKQVTGDTTVAFVCLRSVSIFAYHYCRYREPAISDKSVLETVRTVNPHTYLDVTNSVTVEEDDHLPKTCPCSIIDKSKFYCFGCTRACILGHLVWELS